MTDADGTENFAVLPSLVQEGGAFVHRVRFKDGEGIAVKRVCPVEKHGGDTIRSIGVDIK